MRVCRHGMDPFKSLTKEECKALQKVDSEICAFQSNPWSPRAEERTNAAKHLPDDRWSDIYNAAAALAGASVGEDDDDELDGDENDEAGSRSVVLL